MVHCPFCKGEVSEDLLRFGGHCPHCFIEIPGEETPTDPGEAARAQEQAKERAVAVRQKTRRGLSAALAFVVVGGGVAAWFATRPPPPKIMMMDDDYFVMPLSEHVDQDVPGIESEAEVAAASKRGSTKRSGSTAASGAIAALSTQAGSSTAEAASPDLTGSTVVEDHAPASLDDMMGPVVKKRTVQAVTLSSDSDIREMIQNVMASGTKQLQTCYERRLKGRPDLKGAWVIQFLIGTDGSTSDVNIKANGMKDGEFEECMSRSVERWHFQALSEPTMTGRKFVFGS